jgi:mannose-6-phosphate isomerase-like protein (cupin superfamily)
MSAVVVLLGQSKSVSFGGLGVVFAISGEVTGGAFSIVEHPIAPGVLVPPHVHTHEDELSYVLEGEIGARIGDEEFVVGPGAYIFKPRGVLHTFWNAGPNPAKILEIISPPGFASFFAEQFTGDPAHDGSIIQKYGLSFDMGWVPELEAKYGVRVNG